MTENSRQSSSDPEKTARSGAMNAAVRILTHRDHSKYELKRKLEQRGFASEVVDAVIQACERLNYIVSMTKEPPGYIFHSLKESASGYVTFECP
jgi:hypothetical protein